ncbi:MAG TPA: CPBP family intramembrane glutamic endopeptidase [Egicoccus sp.]|nr:CPBP family intramembrane glutamic endopeptidase [Egicoccus sp.]HSK23174.1 CPBP family intramembrane glutamic endopeptidase [Egicoccus sp.]
MTGVAGSDGSRALGLALGGLGVSNLVVNRWLPDAFYVPWNLSLTAGLAWLAHRAGITAAQLGLDRRRLRQGLGTGAVAAGAVVLAYAATLRRPDPSVLHDRRVRDLDRRDAWYLALVRIPLGTVVAEEFAFRGVVPALVRNVGAPAWFADTVSSVMFGIWHLLPSRELAVANERAGLVARRSGPRAVPALSVASMTAAGVVLQHLRRRGGHLATPVAAHWASNALGVVAARRLGRR